MGGLAHSRYYLRMARQQSGRDRNRRCCAVIGGLAAIATGCGGAPGGAGALTDGGGHTNGGLTAAVAGTSALGGSHATTTTSKLTVTGGTANPGSTPTAGGTHSTGGNTNAAGASATFGTLATGGNPSVAGSTNIGGTAASAGSSAVTTITQTITGGTANSGSTPTAGGTNAAGGTASAAGGHAAGGTPATAGNPSVAGSTNTGGTAASAGASAVCGAGGSGPYAGLPNKAAIMSVLHLANDYFTQKWPDPTQNIDASHPSNLWTRAVYYEGLMGLYAVEPDATRQTSYYDYAVTWGASPSHPWQLRGGGTTTRNADDQCCGQTYIDLYTIDPQPVRIHDIKADIDGMLTSGSGDGDWTWVDAIHMAAPVFAKLGAQYADTSYWEKMHSLYANTKTTQGLYNTTDHLWWRDSTFKPPYTTPNGKQCYWSRGNGWVIAALARMLDTLPASANYRAEYSADFTAMAGALRGVQRADGSWNVSLADANDYPGPETSGTALFTYALAWAMRNGTIDAGTYASTVVKAWCALASVVHPSGALGYVQGTGNKPADGQPVTYDSVPNYEDFGVGAFLLAGTEVWKLAP